MEPDHKDNVHELHGKQAKHRFLKVKFMSYMNATNLIDTINN